MSADAPQEPEQAERLATWLEDLGLAGHLGDAGLPTFTRDEGGRAHWRDPATGAPLSADQLSDLDDLLHHEGSERRHAVPVPLVQVARLARQRERLLAEGWFDYAALATVRGASLESTRFWVHKTAAQHRLLVLADPGTQDRRTVVPAFQLDSAGEPRADLTPVLEPLLAAGMDPWRAWAWLTQPAALLGGLVPEQQTADPEAVPMILHAALRLAERVSARS